MKALLIRVAKVLLKLAMDQALQKALPVIYKQIDAEVPKLLIDNAPPSVVKNHIAHAISTATNGKVDKSMIELVLLAYNPVKAAIIKK